MKDDWLTAESWMILESKNQAAQGGGLTLVKRKFQDTEGIL